jgi:hypothetical protein
LEFDETILIFYTVEVARAVAQLVDTLCYKPEGCGFDSQWYHWIFLIDIP